MAEAWIKKRIEGFMTDFIINIEKLILKIENVELLKGLNLFVPDNKRVGITGPSGCGKTTLLRSIISGHLPSGSTHDRFFIRKNGKKGPKIAYIPQEGGLLPWFTLQRNLMTFIKNEISTKEIKPRINEIIEKLELTNCVNNYPDMLSGGEKQRGLLANAILIQPDLFIADEPLTEVDLERKWKALLVWSAAMKEIQASLILISHDVEILVYLCDEIIVLKGNPGEIFSKHNINCEHPRTKYDIINGEPGRVRRELLSILVEVR